MIFFHLFSLLLYSISPFPVRYNILMKFCCFYTFPENVNKPRHFTKIVVFG